MQRGTAACDTAGRYAIYLAAGLYGAYVGSAPCAENSFAIPVGTKIQNLNY
ncbi:MAG: hypothetical protein KKI08_07455 [Armatimonadetes bacterium]|nr:hypothetical protein [Armatimonadota bacterium]